MLKTGREKPITTLDPRELVNTRLLKGVDLESVMGLLETCPIKRLQAGKVLIYAGKKNNTVYFLLSGRLGVHLKLHMKPIATLEAGEIVGEISVIDGRPTTANVLADKDCRLMELDEPTFWSLLDSSSEVGHNLLYILASRLRQGDSLLATGQEFQLEYARYTILDAVTGLNNRRWFDDLLGKQMNRCMQGELNLSVLLLSIDYFGRYNTTHGRGSGDCALHSVAWTLRASMRPGELIARYGGGEFVVLLPNTAAEQAEKLAERVSQAVARSTVHSIDRKELPSVSVSVGIAQMAHEDTDTSFISAARYALQDAQHRGGNRVSYLRNEE